MIRKTNRETVLEKRIARLENMVKNEHRARKFENVDMMSDLENALDDSLGEFYNVNVTTRGGKFIVDVDDGEPEWSIRGTFEVAPTNTYYVVSVIDGDGKLEYKLGRASDMEEAAELIFEEINQWAMDL
jgi:hypothetical protein